MLQFNTILHPTDLSDNSRSALKVAHSLARDHHAKLILISVIDAPPSGAFNVREPQIAVESLTLEERHKARELISRMAASISDIPVETEVLIGRPAEAIVDMAEKRNADLIIMGTHGRTGLTHLLMGSVAEFVLRHAQCPVLTVRPGTGKHLNREVPTALATSAQKGE